MVDALTLPDLPPSRSLPPFLEPLNRNLSSPIAKEKLYQENWRFVEASVSLSEQVRRCHGD